MPSLPVGTTMYTANEGGAELVGKNRILAQITYLGKQIQAQVGRTLISKPYM